MHRMVSLTPQKNRAYNIATVLHSNIAMQSCTLTHSYLLHRNVFVNHFPYANQSINSMPMHRTIDLHGVVRIIAHSHSIRWAPAFNWITAKSVHLEIVKEKYLSVLTQNCDMEIGFFSQKSVDFIESVALLPKHFFFMSV